ncbi:MAG: tetratricopeptide repeat protein, partial [Anaerolineaceae bacterium]|nr:tetratricopeptide repeat protein [Anaerolineaceae bacterium]
MRTTPIQNNPSLILLILLPLIGAVVFAIAPQPIALVKALSAASQAEAANRPADAAAELRLALSFQPWRMDLRERLGRNELAAGNIDAATAVFEFIAAGRGLSTEGALALGESYRLAGDTQSALDTWERLIESENAPVEAYRRICELQRAVNNVEQAIAACRAWVNAHPEDPLAVYLLGLLLAVQTPSEAVGYLEQAREIDPALKPRLRALVEGAKKLAEDHRDAVGWLELGRTLASRNDWDLAAFAFKEAAHLEPGYAEAWAFWGEARNQTGLNGLEQLERALSLNPRSALGHVFLALHWRRQGDLDQALRHIRAAVRSEPKQAAWQIELGIILSERGDLQAALARYRTAAELEPANPFYWRLLARFCILNAIEVRGVGLP